MRNSLVGELLHLGVRHAFRLEAHVLGCNIYEGVLVEGVHLALLLGEYLIERLMDSGAG